MNFWRRWNWGTLEVQCYRTYLMERCLKLGLLLEKGHKEEFTVKEEEVWACGLGSTQGLMCHGGRWFPPRIVPVTLSPNRPISLQDRWVRNKNIESVILKTQTWRTLVTRPPWAIGISFQYWHHLIVIEAMAVEITGMLVDCWDAPGFCQLEVWSQYWTLGSQCSWITWEGKQG